MDKRKKVAVIGGGAAGFFAALSVAKHHPDAKITLFEKTTKVLAKVKISGGGRCNVTHDCRVVNELIMAYPRGGRKLKSIFHQFQVRDTIQWFEARGVQLKTEADGRMFPTTDQSQSIIDCLVEQTKINGIEIKLKTAVVRMHNNEGQWILQLSNDQQLGFDKVIVTTGGSPKASGLKWLEDLGHKIVPPVPSLFTFNLPREPLVDLMGIVAQNVQLRIIGTKVQTQGPLLITHWGLSGPAALKASAFGARALAEKNYQFDLSIHWNNEVNADAFFTRFEAAASQHSHKKIFTHNPTTLPLRLWQFLLEKLNIPKERRWNEIGKKNHRRLAEILVNDQYSVQGKTTFKEEFVTCGGVALSNINLNTMESKQAQGIYFAGEVLDIDAITGGYNFQAAWSSGFVAGKLG